MKSKNKLFFASGNRGKIKEIKRLLPDYEILDLADIDIDIKETGDTFKENALIKAKTIFDLYGIQTLADDSGLSCKGLNGAPGVHSKRYSESNNDLDNNLLLVKNLQGKNRECKFVSCLCLYSDEISYFVGEVKGEIIDTPRGDNGFGYDPIFYFKELDKTFAELEIEEKNKYSHRARALKKLLKSGKLWKYWF